MKALPGWAADDLRGALKSFQTSCAVILRRSPGQSLGAGGRMGKAGDWQPACRAARNLGTATPEQARAFFAQHFNSYWIQNGATGKFTGYYETGLKGSPSKTGSFIHPVYGKPATLKQANGAWGHVQGGRFQPFHSRAEINAGALEGGKAPVLFWAEDPIDVYFLHVQGSGQVTFPDGTVRHIGFAAKNGHEYYAIGRELIKIGEMRPEEVHMRSIRDWLQRNPGRARQIMEKNSSYIFFRFTPEGGPLGAMGVPLTPRRSLAVDARFIPYGVPLWVDIRPNARIHERLQQLMVAQDTGSAIRGAVRGDYYWGAGHEAGEKAGVMDNEGRWAVLLPKQLRP
jgi:membrane-bound lytic murein transglycosylase A